MGAHDGLTPFDPTPSLKLQTVVNPLYSPHVPCMRNLALLKVE